MSLRAKRIVRWTVLIALVLMMSVAAGVASLARGERIDRLWTSAVIDGSGNAQISEVIDYDFGLNSKHGIFRVIPGLGSDALPKVSSPDAPSQFTTTDHGSNVELRIGDPATTVTGQHRYDIAYPLATLMQGNRVSWNAVGNEWIVGIHEAEAHLVAPFEFTDVDCAAGVYGADEPCEVEQPEPGHLVVRTGGLESHEGFTIFATRGQSLGTSASAPSPPSERPPTRSTFHPGALTLIVLAAGLIGGVTTALILLRAGRERVGGDGGAADAAWANNSTSFRRIDSTKLADLAAIEFAPPRELTPAQGGVLLQRVQAQNYKAAWLMQAALDGYLRIEGTGKDITLHRVSGASGYANLILDRAFVGRNAIQLGTYDSSFADAWGSIDSELHGWAKNSGLWDPSGDSNKFKAYVVGCLCIIPTLTVTIAFAYWAGASGGIVAALTGLLAFVSGGLLATIAFAGELRVLTPQGSGLWIRTESFRRFLHASEAQHVERAAEQDLLLEYTAWAVALGEADRWSNAMKNSSIPPETIQHNGFLSSAPYFASAASTSSVSPSSSSGGGGSSSGGGGGGGGGGSW